MTAIWFIVFYLVLVVVPMTVAVKRSEGQVTVGDFLQILFLGWILGSIWIGIKVDEWSSRLMSRRLF